MNELELLLLQSKPDPNSPFAKQIDADDRAKTKLAKNNNISEKAQTSALSLIKAIPQINCCSVSKFVRNKIKIPQSVIIKRAETDLAIAALSGKIIDCIPETKKREFVHNNNNEKNGIKNENDDNINDDNDEDDGDERVGLGIRQPSFASLTTGHLIPKGLNEEDIAFGKLEEEPDPVVVLTPEVEIEKLPIALQVQQSASPQKSAELQRTKANPNDSSENIVKDDDDFVVKLTKRNMDRWKEMGYDPNEDNLIRNNSMQTFAITSIDKPMAYRNASCEVFYPDSQKKEIAKKVTNNSKVKDAGFFPKRLKSIKSEGNEVFQTLPVELGNPLPQKKKVNDEEFEKLMKSADIDLEKTNKKVKNDHNHKNNKERNINNDDDSDNHKNTKSDKRTYSKNNENKRKSNKDKVKNDDDDIDGWASYQISSNMQSPQNGTYNNSATNNDFYNDFSFDDSTQIKSPFYLDFTGVIGDQEIDSQRIPERLGYLIQIENPPIQKESATYLALCGVDIYGYGTDKVNNALRRLKHLLQKCISKGYLEESAYIQGIIDYTNKMVCQIQRLEAIPSKTVVDDHLNYAKNEFATKKKEWDLKKAEIDTELELALNDLQMRYNEEKANLVKKWDSRSQQSRYNKPSPKLIEMRHVALKMLKTHRFEEVSMVQRSISSSERNETEDASNRMKSGYLNALKLLDKKYKIEESSIRTQFDARRSHFDRQAKAEMLPYERRVKKFSDNIESIDESMKRNPLNERSISRTNQGAPSGTHIKSRNASMMSNLSSRFPKNVTIGVNTKLNLKSVVMSSKKGKKVGSRITRPSSKRSGTSESSSTQLLYDSML